MIGQSPQRKERESTAGQAIRTLAILLVTLALVTSAIGVTAAATPDRRTASGATDATDTRRTAEASAASACTNETQITLITGHRVIAERCGDETQYRLAGDAHATITETRHGTYVVPNSVDLARFDRSLFNVDRLREEGLTDDDRDGIPVIVDRAGGVVSANDRRDHADLRRTRDLDSVDAVAGDVPKERADAVAHDLATDASVEGVYLDRKVSASAFEAGEQARVERARAQANVTGENVTVAVLDSGVNESHPALEGAERLERDFTAENTTDDLAGHGTHVAGIITGNDTRPNATYRGVAPEAEILDVRVLDAYGDGRVSNVIAGLEFAVEEDADVVSMSLGYPATTLRSEDPMAQAVENAARSDVTMVASGGERPGPRQVTAPGIHDEVITVGMADGRTLPAQPIAGPTPEGSFVKPNLLAPGTGIEGPAVDGGYTTNTGTSFAAPAVSGTAALLAERYPNRTGATTRSAMVTSTDPLPNGTVYTRGSGLLNASRALQTNVSITPSTVDFGRIEAGTTETATIRVTNHGPDSRTLETDWQSSPVDENWSADGWLNQSSVTLAPGETEQIELTVHTAGGPTGLYTGAVQIGDQRAIFGYEKIRTVTVEKRGTAVDGDRVTLIDESDGQTYGPETLTNGTATFEVNGTGNYSAVSTGDIDGQPALTVNRTGRDADRIVLDEAATVARSVDTGSIADNQSTVHTRALRATLTVGPYDTRLVADDAPTPTVYVSPDAGATYGIRRVLTVESDGFDAPDIYHLKHVASDVEASVERSVERDDLRQVRTRYYRDRPGTTYRATIADAQFDDVPLAEMYTNGSIGDRHAQDHYVSPSIEQYQDAYATDDLGYPTWTASPANVTLDPDTESATIRKQPYRSQIADWSLNESGLRTRLFPTVGQGPNPFVISDLPAEQYDLWVNGTHVRSFEENRAEATVRHRAENVSSMRLRVSDRHEMSTLGNQTTTTFSATTTDDARPPAVPDLEFEDQSATNALPAAPTNVSVSASDIGGNVTDVRLAVAIDDANRSDDPFAPDSGWQTVDLQRQNGTHTGTIDLSGVHDRLSVAVRASDDGGNAVESVARNALVVGTHDPVANGSIEPRSATVNETFVRLNASASTDDQAIEQFAWDLDGDGTIDTTTTAPVLNHTYETAGRVEPRVTVVDSQNLTDTASLGTITVDESTATPNVTIGTNRTTVTPGQEIRLNATAPSDEFARYEWSIGNQTLNGSTVTFAPTAPGPYTVELRAIDENGTNTTDRVNLTVDSLPAVLDAQPSDLDGDGRYEDVDGDGRLTFVDVNELFQNADEAAIQNHDRAYDFTDDGTVDLQDVIALFEQV